MLDDETHVKTCEHWLVIYFTLAAKTRDPEPGKKKGGDKAALQKLSTHHNLDFVGVRT